SADQGKRARFSCVCDRHGAQRSQRDLPSGVRTFLGAARSADPRWSATRRPRMVPGSRSAGVYRWLLGDGPAQWVPVLAGVGVLEIEQVVVQVDDRISAPARRERVNGDELAQSQGGGKGP